MQKIQFDGLGGMIYTKKKDGKSLFLDEVWFDESVDYLIRRADFNAILMLDIAKEYEDCTFDFSVATKDGVELPKYMWIHIIFPKEEK